MTSALPGLLYEYLSMLNAQSSGLTQELIRQHEAVSMRPSQI